MFHELRPLWDEYGTHANFEMVSVGLAAGADTAEAQLAVAERRLFRWTKVFDHRGQAASDYAISSIPYLVLVNPEGQIVVDGIAPHALATIKATLTANLQ